MLDRSEVGKRGYLNEEFRLFHLKDSRAQKLDYHYHEFNKILLLVSGSGSYVVVVGGVNVDIGGKSHSPLVSSDSNPGTVRVSLGGVGRNIAHNLSLMGTDVRLLTAYGDDVHGQRIAASCSSAVQSLCSMMATTPPSCSCRPAMIFSKVDLPQPLGPTMDARSPSCRSKESPLSTWCSPKCL